MARTWGLAVISIDIQQNLSTIKENVFDDNPVIIFKRQDQVLITRLGIGYTKITHQHLLSKENKIDCEHCNKSYWDVQNTTTKGKL